MVVRLFVFVCACRVNFAQMCIYYVRDIVYVLVMLRFVMRFSFILFSPIILQRYYYYYYRYRHCMYTT